MNNWKTKTFVIAIIVGAVSGALAGYVLVRRAEENDQQPRLKAGDGVKVGLGVLGLLRLVSEFSPD
jgi:hypothetical protein